MPTILYIHGFNGNPKGGTFQGLENFFKNKSNFRLISQPFPQLHTNVENTQKQIEELIDKNKIDILIGASLGGFYTLCCKRPVKKIAINPCMQPSIEIPLLKDRDTGLPIHIEKKVLDQWKKLEEYKLESEYKNALGIFGKNDTTFHYDQNHNFSPLFKKIFSSDYILVEGKHSLEESSLAEGLNLLEKNFKFFS